MASPKTTLTSLPPELFLTIFSYLPHRTIKTVISPLSSTTRTSPSKSAIQNLSLTSKSLRTTSTPYIFESITIKSLAQLEEFVKDGGIGEMVGRYVRRVVMRWDAYGGVMKLSQQFLPTESLQAFMKRAVELMPNLNTLMVDFPGAINALAYAVMGEDGLKNLQGVSVRNGRAEYGGDVSELLCKLGKLGGLQTLAVDGTTFTTYTDTELSKSSFHLDRGDFGELVNLEVINISRFSDNLLFRIMRAASKTTALTIKNCGGITLSGTRKLLMKYGDRLHYLSLEILKGWVQEADRPDHEAKHEHELYRFSEDEHLCPVIRDYCKNVQILDIYTNKICKEILFPKATGSGAMTSGLPTPPESPDLPPTRVLDIPTPPTDVTTDSRGFIRTSILPPPLFSFQNLSLLHQGEEDRLVQAPVEKRQRLKRVKLRIPYDSSCYGIGVGGPSLQQRYTTLCDGTPAIELLEVGKKAFEEGLTELANVQGHWKGGPYLIMP
ncbi:hypothetical protein TWF506_007429 [Arthrobotrys conoides]|uniref:F-box domain-containing protein n=1 Tax=Arthrobotrys conoides TaxID=74498 RepID=A0AAN8NFN9_9PEZI